MHCERGGLFVMYHPRFLAAGTTLYRSVHGVKDRRGGQCSLLIRLISQLGRRGHWYRTAPPPHRPSMPAALTNRSVSATPRIAAEAELEPAHLQVPLFFHAFFHAGLPVTSFRTLCVCDTRLPARWSPSSTLGQALG
jgi:hypothetical protein